MLKIITINQTINTDSKHINKHEVDMQIKKFNKGNKNPNKTDFLSSDTKITLTKLK